MIKDIILNQNIISQLRLWDAAAIWIKKKDRLVFANNLARKWLQEWPELENHRFSKVDLLGYDGRHVVFDVISKSLGDTEINIAYDYTNRDEVSSSIFNMLRKKEEILDNLPIGVFETDRHQHLSYSNQEMAEWLEGSLVDIEGTNINDFIIHGEHLPESHRQIIWKGNKGKITPSLTIKTAHDLDLWISIPLSSINNDTLFDMSPVCLASIDINGQIIIGNRMFREQFGELSNLSGILNEDTNKFLEVLNNFGHGPIRKWTSRSNILHVRQYSKYGFIIELDRTDPDREIELKFAETQKLQAMGQLAGGVAHDFNNLLTAINGFSELLLQRHGPGDPSFADIMQIRQNANRAASLVRQLLAFSRRQTLQPKALDITTALSELSHLLNRLLGEKIKLNIEHGRDIGKVWADPVQFDQVIINLAVNARDAMPKGGNLNIATANISVFNTIDHNGEYIPPGEYIMIRVGDTGTGIAQENIQRIFEPFFTTKEVGAGTGLGLAMVHGFVRQSGGYIGVESIINNGTSFFIYLPLYKEQPPAPNLDKKPHINQDLTGSAKILLVEDEESVRKVSSRALKAKGYEVTEAENGEAAVNILRENQFALVISDVVMPGNIGGIALAEILSQESPNTKVILISGYSEELVADGLSPEQHIEFLAKPFSLAQLAAKVKEVLNQVP